MEDKQKIMNLLCRALQATRNASDLISLTYIPHEEHVIAKFEEGDREINVAMDSGTAMIRDVVNHLEC
ncbi:hypothetical protein ACTQZS_15105 [Bilifractor sp. LCP19S3_H10]|uniref:hypothetical protein n=1 Tax=Bilifractor sp. LCP19S3_H10 TaxID=3438736 RepID=UPI002A8E86DA|nr:hypothetical protein [Bilifractor sp.]